MTKYALWMTSFLASASRWRALGVMERAGLCAANARGCYQSLRYHLDRCTRQAVRGSLAEAIVGIVAQPARRMELMPVGDRGVYWHLELRAEMPGEDGVKSLKDGFGKAVFDLGGLDGLGDAAAEKHPLGGLGDGELDLDHGGGSLPQPGSGVN